MFLIITVISDSYHMFSKKQKTAHFCLFKAKGLNPTYTNTLDVSRGSGIH